MFASVRYLLLSASSQPWPVCNQQLVTQWLSSGGSGLAEEGCVLLLWHGAGWHTMALEPAVYVALAVCQTGNAVPAEDNSHSCCKPGCLSLMSGLQLMLIHTPLAALLPSPCSDEPSILVTACLSLRQPRKDIYPQPARRVMQIPEVSAPICRAAVSQALLSTTQHGWWDWTLL